MADIVKVLIVDDDEAFVESNRDLLEACGYEVHSANDGASGLETARRVKPDVMILDVMMRSDTEGLDVARRVRDFPELQTMRVILVTGVTRALHLPADLAPDEHWLPVDRVLEKPIQPERLIKELQRAMEKGRVGRGGER
jgi:two-component system, OmpR family, alkaline phosphatase synthesis response regulator PhoP